MPGELVIDADLDPIFRIGAAVEVLRVQGLALGVRNEIVEQQLEFLRRQATIFFPPNGLFGLRIDDDELVLGAAAGVNSGLGAEGTALHERALAGGDRFLNKNRIGQIPVDCCELFQAKFVSAVGAVSHTGFLHTRLRNPFGPCCRSLSAPSPFTDG